MTNRVRRMADWMLFIYRLKGHTDILDEQEINLQIFSDLWSENLHLISADTDSHFYNLTWGPCDHALPQLNWSHSTIGAPIIYRIWMVQ